MAVVIFHSKATFVSSGISFSPLGETGEGFSCFALQSRHASQKPFDRLRASIIPGQTVTKEKLQRAPSARFAEHLPQIRQEKV